MSEVLTLITGQDAHEMQFQIFILCFSRLFYKVC